MTSNVFSWRQPICGMCHRLRYPGRPPIRQAERERETCVDCGQPTTSGIYIRIDPACAKHPTRTE